MAEEKNDSGGGIGDLVKSAVAAIIIGAGGGGAFGYFALPNAAGAPAPHSAQTTEEKRPAVGRFPNDALAVEISSIIADLESSPKMRVRLDVSIIIAHGTPETTTLKNEVKEDVIAYLKGLTVSDFQGVRGFQNLREQLDDRARVRGRGAILGLLIGGLVLE